MNEQTLTEQIIDAVAEATDADIRTFAEAGVLSGNAGLVVRLADGSEFQVTVVQSR